MAEYQAAGGSPALVDPFGLTPSLDAWELVAGSTGALRGYYVDVAGEMVGAAEVSFVVDTTARSFVDMEAAASVTRIATAVGFKGFTTVKLYGNTSGRRTPVVTPTTSSPVVGEANTNVTFGRVGF